MFTFLINLVIGIVLSVASTLIQQAFAQDTKPAKTRPAGVRGSLQTGGDNPLGFIMGYYATAGQLEYAGTWGNVDETPNAYYTKAISLSDIQVNGVTGMFVNGEKVTIGGTATGDFGYPISEYTVDGTEHLWVKFYIGTQTTRDPLLDTAFGSDADRPWASTHVGNGVAYAVVTALVNRELFSGLPEYLFEVEGIKLYDPRLDTTAGGSGSHRLATPSTWAYSNNPVVAIYNILCGIYYGGTEWVWGPQNIAQARLPYANWAAEMNKCDALISLAAGGTEKRFRFGLEVSVDQEPHAVIGELLKACEGRIAEIGGVYKILVAEPGSSVKSITDEDIVITEGQSYEPFPGLESTYNGITATYPEPLEAWESKEAPPRYNATLETLDDARRLPFSTAYKAAPYPNQVQRIMLASINETRRFRRHSATMPAEWWEYEPLDVYDWTSTRNSYTAKEFLILVMDDLPNGNQIVGSQEIDPTDYNGWTTADELPWDTAPLVVARPAPQAITGWAVVPYIFVDAAARSRRPGIEVSYAGGMVDVRGVRVQVRRNGETDPFFDSDEFPYDPATASPSNYIVGDYILPNQALEARGKFIPFSGRETSWSAWLDVTTPDVRTSFTDLDDAVNNFQEWIGVNLRDLLDDAQLRSALNSDQDFANFEDKQTLRTELRSGDARVTAGYTQAILFATGPDSALADSITQLDASVDAVSATGTFRMTASVAPSGYSARIGAEAMGGTPGDWRSAAWYLDVNSTPGVPTRYVVVAEQTAIMDSGGNVLALFETGGAYFDNARIHNLAATNIAADAIVAGKIAAGAIDTSDLFVSGVAITDVIAANAVTVGGFFAYTGGDVFVPSGAGNIYTGAAVAITTNGGSVLILFTARAYGDSPDGTPFFSVYKNGGLLGSAMLGNYVFDGTFGSGYNSNKAFLTTGMFEDTSPGIGSNTYSIYSSSPSYSYYVAGARIYAQNFKR